MSLRDLASSTLLVVLPLGGCASDALGSLRGGALGDSFGFGGLGLTETGGGGGTGEGTMGPANLGTIGRGADPGRGTAVGYGMEGMGRRAPLESGGSAPVASSRSVQLPAAGRAVAP